MPVVPLLLDDGLRFRSFVHARGGRIEDASVAYVVVHKDLVAEVLHVTGRAEQAATAWKTQGTRYVSQARSLLEQFREQQQMELFYEDRWIAVFAF